MNDTERAAYIERRNECMAYLSRRELIAELRDQKDLVIKLDEDHKKCAKEMVAVMKK